MFSFTGNKNSIAGGGASNFYGKPGVNFYTQLKTVTSLWASNDASLAERPQGAMITQS
jgi:malonate-semialdehyde dehydrogenase (acetylating)/methylmalonate-semialdehyde dehydrogenase